MPILPQAICSEVNPEQTSPLTSRAEEIQVFTLSYVIQKEEYFGETFAISSKEELFKLQTMWEAFQPQEGLRGAPEDA